MEIILIPHDERWVPLRIINYDDEGKKNIIMYILFSVKPRSYKYSIPEQKMTSIKTTL